MKNQGRKSITLSLQVSVIGNIPSGNFKLGSPKEVFLIKNIIIVFRYDSSYVFTIQHLHHEILIMKTAYGDPWGSLSETVTLSFGAKLVQASHKALKGKKLK